MPFLTCLQINNQIIHFPSYPIPSVAPGLTENHTRGVFNRACSLYDASGSSASATWNLTSYEAKTAEVEGGWVIEMALPLDQFELTNVLEINVCTTDTNGPVQRNLGTTDGAFHNRGVFKQVMLK